MDFIIGWERKKERENKNRNQTHRPRASVHTKERIYLSVKTKLHHLQSNQKWANSHLKRPFRIVRFFSALLLFNHSHTDLVAIMFAVAVVMAKMLFCLVIKQVNIFGPRKMVRPYWLASLSIVSALFHYRKRPSECARTHTKQHNVCDVGRDTHNQYDFMYISPHTCGKRVIYAQEKPIHWHIGLANFWALFHPLDLSLSLAHSFSSEIFVLLDRRRRCGFLPYTIANNSWRSY